MTTELPWDRYGPEPVMTELPYVPPPAPPPRHAAPESWVPDHPEQEAIAQDMATAATEDYNLTQLANEAFHAALNEALPGVKQDAMDLLKTALQSTAKGQSVDWGHPVITATTSTGRELVVADAKSRSWRTLVQGLIFDVFAAIVAAIALLTGMDPFEKQTWIAFGVLLLKSVTSAVISYFMRLRITPTMKVEDEKVKVLPVPGAAVESRAA